MNKTGMVAIGFFLSGLMVAAVHAGPNDGSGARQDVRSVQSVTSAPSAPMKGGLSKRNKAVIGQSEAAKARREKIQSSDTGTASKISRRNKAVMQQSEEAKKRKGLVRSSVTGTRSK